jgi:hypothetical protein
LQQADKSGDGNVDFEEFAQLYTKYPIKHRSEEELQAIEHKWELPERIVCDSRSDRKAIEQNRPPRWEMDAKCQPGVMVMIVPSTPALAHMPAHR